MTPEGEFYNDWWFYEWGKTERTFSYAVWDEAAELMSEEEMGVFNDVLGIEVGDNVPEIMLLAQRATSDIYRANKVAKNHFKRVRPFAFYGEPSITPEMDEELAKEWSYPSGHSARGWMFGPGGNGFMRLNIGSPRSILQEAMERLRRAVMQMRGMSPND